MYRSDPCYSKDMKIAILQTKVYDSFDFHIRIGILRFQDVLTVWKFRLFTDWFLGEPLENCDTVCERNGLKCTDDQFALHNDDVDTSEEVLKIIEELGGETSAKSCKKGDFPAVPVFNKDSFCMYSDAARKSKASEFDCGRVAGPPKANKQRICYCHKG